MRNINIFQRISTILDCCHELFHKLTIFRRFTLINPRKQLIVSKGSGQVFRQ